MNNLKPIKGIYLIERIVEDTDTDCHRFYIGQAVDIFNRLHQHCVNSDQYIDKTMQEVGLMHFIFRILEIAHNRKDLDKMEKKWIKFYADKYGEDSLYNISLTNNINPAKLPREITGKIKELFNEEIGRSIYAIAEAFNIPWKTVVNIRKPMLKTHGLCYDTKSKKVVNINTREAPANWKGAQLTAGIVRMLREADFDLYQLEDSCIASKTDIESYLIQSSNGSLPYDCAPPIKI